MKGTLVATAVVALVFGAVGGAAVTAWQFNGMHASPGTQSLTQLQSQLSYMAGENGVLSGEQTQARLQASLAIATVRVGQTFDSLSEHEQAKARAAAERIEATPALRVADDTDLQAWSAAVRKCMLGAQEAASVAKCSIASRTPATVKPSVDA